jgi:hypothetical protein
MDKTKALLRELKNPNPAKRYDACERLCVADAITDEVRSALIEASSDHHPLVADAARRALEVHTRSSSRESPLSTSESRPTPQPSAGIKAKRLIAGIVGLPLACITLCVLAGVIVDAQLASSAQREAGFTRGASPEVKALLAQMSQSCTPPAGQRSPLNAISWAAEPWREQAFLVAICQFEAQAGRPATTAELYSIQRLFKNYPLEVATYACVGLPFLVLSVPLLRYAFRGPRKPRSSPSPARV